MHHVGDLAHGFGDDGALGDGTAHDLQPIARLDDAIVAQGANPGVTPGLVAQEPAQEGLAHLAGGARDEHDAVDH